MRRPSPFALALTLSLAVLPVSAQPSSGKVARVLDIDGKTLMTNRRTDGRWFQAYEGMSSYLKEHLRTDERTQATLEFAIGGRAGVSPGTEIEIVGQRDVDVVGNKIVVRSGKVWAKIDKQKSQLQIQTSGGVIGIEGTELLVAADENGRSEVLLFEGQISLTDSQGNQQTLRPGDYAEMGGSGGGGACVLSYSSGGLRSLVVERFPEFTSFLASCGITTVPKSALTGAPIPLARPGLDEVVSASTEGLVEDPVGLTPSRSTVSGPPTFSWPAVGGAAEYMILLGSDSGMQDLAFSARAEGASFTVPSGAPSLAAGRYYLRVVPLDDGGHPVAHAYQTWFESAGWQSDGILADQPDS